MAYARIAEGENGYLQELWAQRHILWVLTIRDIKLKYKQTLGGILWAVAQPLMITVVFTLLFSKVLGVPSGGVPYPLYSLSGLLIWTVFAGGTNRAVASLVLDSKMVKMARFPRIFLPIASCLSPLLDFLVAFVILLGMMIAYSFYPNLKILALPLFLLMALAFSSGLGMWLSAINAHYRDVNWIVGQLLTMAMLASPVAYGSEIAQGSQWYWLYQINPMAAVIGGFRWALLEQPFPHDLLWSSIGIVGVIFATGILFFKSKEKGLADVV